MQAYWLRDQGHRRIYHRRPSYFLRCRCHSRRVQTGPHHRLLGSRKNRVSVPSVTQSGVCWEACGLVLVSFWACLVARNPSLFVLLPLWPLRDALPSSFFSLRARGSSLSWRIPVSIPAHHHLCYVSCSDAMSTDRDMDLMSSRESPKIACACNFGATSRSHISNLEICPKYERGQRGNPSRCQGEVNKIPKEEMIISTHCLIYAEIFNSILLKESSFAI